jgi:hypothetical protein
MRWKVLKTAIRLSKRLESGAVDDDTYEEITAFVVEAFGDQFSVDDLGEMATFDEMLAVMNTITAKAQRSLSGNPTRPG